jgi:hypothetical protein
MMDICYLVVGAEAQGQMLYSANQLQEYETIMLWQRIPGVEEAHLGVNLRQRWKILR